MQTYAPASPPPAAIEHEASPRRYILVPLDGSAAAESILIHALPLAQAAHLGVMLLYVIGPPSLWETMSPTWNYYPYADLPDEERWAREYLATVAKRMQATGVPTRTFVVYGRPGPTIVAMTKRFPQILLMAMAIHARSSVLRTFLSQVMRHVVRETTIPLLIVKTSGHLAPTNATPPAYSMIAVPLDLPMRTGEALAKALLITQATGATLVLATFSAKHAATPQTLHISQWNKPNDRKTSAEAGAAQDLHMRKIAVRGRLSQALLRFCRQERPDMLVMAPKDLRHFTPRWLLGAGRRIIRELAIPVLLVPPEA